MRTTEPFIVSLGINLMEEPYHVVWPTEMEVSVAIIIAMSVPLEYTTVTGGVVVVVVTVT